MPEKVVITTQDLEPAVRLREALVRDGCAVELLTPAERLADVKEPALLVLSGGLDQKRARKLLREAAGYEHLPVVGFAEDAAQADPAEARRRGITEVVRKPVDADEAALLVRRLLSRRRLRLVTGLIGDTEPIHEMLERVVQIAPVHSTALITGESGTGKELVARGIHALSPRRHRPFIAANVAALPETLLESELFGHEKGAFTGAVAQRKGLFELAHRGTLFLDEIGEMPLSTQTKLLRVLEAQEFLRVGGESPIKVDVRVIAATNQDLRQLAEIGDFRRDLYYRLNVLHIELPPLRERREDIPRLIDAFLRQFSREHDRPGVAISGDAMQIFLEYDWPGNVRELKNLVESMVVLSPGGVIRADDVPPSIRSASGRRRPQLPVPVANRRARGEAGASPELEFVFRTLLQLRMDIEDLRKEFDEYRRAHPDFPGPVQLPYPYPYAPQGLAAPVPTIEEAEVRNGEDADDGLDDDDDENAVIFRSGMTIQDLEREAILAALREVGGNRRKAAERLGIGERTLYRKLKEYEIRV